MSATSSGGNNCFRHLLLIKSVMENRQTVTEEKIRLCVFFGIGKLNVKSPNIWVSTNDPKDPGCIPGFSMDCV